MDEIKFSDDVFEQIKDFEHWYLTEEQKSLIDKLILNEELKERYKRRDLCKFFGQASGNNEVDKFIQEAQLKAKNKHQILEWIEYDKFEDIKYLAKGGFGTIYKAIWKEDPFWKKNYGFPWKIKRETKVALKCLHNSQDISAEFLKELESNIIANESGSDWLGRCFGITKDPKTNNFTMVMELQKCSLRQHLNDNFNSLSWDDKVKILYGISIGIKSIHEGGLIHRDLHCGNILAHSAGISIVADLGLCQPANIKSSQGDDKKIYGVLPYVAPEVLRGNEYTQASDIYGFGIIAYEICTGLPPYHNIAHNELLAIKICQGLRPKSNYKIPQPIVDIINQCWDADPSKRPNNADDLFALINNLNILKVDSAIYNKQIEEADEINKKLSSTVRLPLSTNNTLSYMTHPQAVYTSRLLDFKNLPVPKNADNNNELHVTEYPESLIMDFTKHCINLKNANNNDELHGVEYPESLIMDFTKHGMNLKNADNNDKLHGVDYPGN
ncbi:hypothetical protein RclHR1_04940005 [Rhizophagus clarus]|uniref:Protein kinase domain-containing protein n=1 Tax=Rhizophagus clarus TaxID=94130 RepID=A0A2Z6RX92_9GLOM|nr:hypothetical protein RclHR1_04940005 [Rhizophagus clarus]